VHRAPCDLSDLRASAQSRMFASNSGTKERCGPNKADTLTTEIELYGRTALNPSSQQ